MKKSMLVSLMILIAGGFTAQAEEVAQVGEQVQSADSNQATIERNEDFDELVMMRVAGENCEKAGVSGYSGAAIRVATHPISFGLLLKNMIVNQNGNTWTDNYVNYEYSRKLHAIMKQRMQDNPGCYNSSSEALNYTVMGGKIQNFINSTLGHRVRGSYEPLNDQLSNLWDRCEKDAGVPANGPGDFDKIAAYYKPYITALTKHPVLLADYKMSEIEEDGLREMIRETNPTSCADITKLRGLLIYKLSKIDLYIRSQLKGDGLPVP